MLGLETAVDLWTFVHAASGVAYGSRRWPLRYGWVLFIGWEALEGVLRHAWPGGPGPFAAETWPNVVADVAASMGCAVLARQAFARAALPHRPLFVLDDER